MSRRTRTGAVASEVGRKCDASLDERRRSPKIRSDRPLHIGLVAPLWYPISPDRGGVEQIIWLLAREIVLLGHQVTLIATGDSDRAVRILPVYPEGIASAMEKGLAFEYSPYEDAAIACAVGLSQEVDVLHSHLGTRLVPFAQTVGKPVLHTIHTSISADMRWLLGQFSGATVSTPSRWQAEALSCAARVHVVTNGIDLEAFPFCRVAEDFLLVLGRIEPRKGVDVAIDVARAAGRRLVIAGHIADSAYFDSRIRPHLDHDRVEWVGPVGGAEKLQLLQRACCLLFPVQWDEAFGLVMVEAMACGTPVVGLSRGAVSEIVVHGRGGFHAAEANALPALVERAVALDRAQVRRTAERYSHHRMAAGYLDLYERMIRSDHRPHRGETARAAYPKRPLGDWTGAKGLDAPPSLRSRRRTVGGLSISKAGRSA